MRHPARTLALVACLALTGSAAFAERAPRPRKAKARAKVARVIEVDPDAIEIDAPPPTTRKRKASRVEREPEAADGDDIGVPATARIAGKRKPARAQRDEDTDDADAKGKRKAARPAHDRDDDDDDDERDEDQSRKTDRVAFRDQRDDADDESADEVADEDEDEPARAPIRLRKHTLGRATKPAKDWGLAIGPYVWASSVDAEVSLGSASVGSGVDFMDITRHTRYGAELLAAVSYQRFKLSNDLMYGVIDLEGAKTVGPLMVSLDGSASSLLVDSNLSYRVIGSDSSAVSLEAFAGVRYQRTKIEAAVGLGGSEVASIEKVTNVADALAGARLYLRPFGRLSASGAVDVGVFGDSTLTWSAAADANVRITSRVLFSLGYRALTMNGATVSMKMHGPRAALQLLF